MRETILINGLLVGEGERLPLPGYSSPPPHNYAFYSLTTGEVWGLRVVQGLVSPWHYTSGESEAPDLLLPYEVNAGYFPPGFLSFACDYLLEQWSITNVSRSVSQHTDTLGVRYPLPPCPESAAHGGVGDW